MIVHQLFAQIYDGIVQNVIVCDNYEMANYLARASYGDVAFAVDCLQYPCGIGDHYHNGAFWTVGEDGFDVPIEPIPTQEQQVAALMDSQNSAAELLLDLEYQQTVALLGLDE